MLITSTVSDGNMHPSLEAKQGEAQQNFETFCAKNLLDTRSLIGLRADPTAEPDTITVIDSIEFDESPLTDRMGNVSVDKRLRTKTLICHDPKRLFGGFVLSADCFPVAFLGTEFWALSHVGRKETRHDLMSKTLTVLNEHEPVENMSIHIGPGVKTLSMLYRGLVRTLADAGIDTSHITTDPRNTLTDTTLFSKRAHRLHLPGRIRGNQVAILQRA